MRKGSGRRLSYLQKLILRVLFSQQGGSYECLDYDKERMEDIAKAGLFVTRIKRNKETVFYDRALAKNLVYFYKSSKYGKVENPFLIDDDEINNRVHGLFRKNVKIPRAFSTSLSRSYKPMIGLKLISVITGVEKGKRNQRRKYFYITKAGWKLVRKSLNQLGR